MPNSPTKASHVGRKRVERPMKASGLVGVSRRKGTRTTIRDERARPACDLVDRNFHADTPDKLWDEPCAPLVQAQWRVI
jgi:transposase InsO family protein